MTVLVCIPYYGCPDFIDKAVRSVLDQTVRDIHVLVVGDGEEPPLHVSDSRLDVFTLPHNRGPYFAQAVALLASPHDWYAPVGADDFVDPDHLETLMAVGSTAVVPGAIWWEAGETTRRDGGLYEVGLFATERLTEIGGHNPAERIGQDTLTMRILRDVIGGVGTTSRPTYHRVRRPGSLTTAPETGFGSRARNEMRLRNRVVFRRVQKLRDPAWIRAYRAALVPARIADEVAEQTLRLSARLGQRVAA